MRELVQLLVQGRRQLRRRRGMTLVEIMIVLTIMASVMGMVGFFAVGAMTRAKVKEAQVMVGKYANFVDEFYVYTGEFPSSLDQLARPPSGVAPFVREVEKDPWSNDYTFRTTGGDGFQVCSNGPDKSSGGDDDICHPRQTS